MRIYPSFKKLFFYLLLPLSIFVFDSSAYAQIKIEGVVIQENNSPVPYASIKLSNHEEGIVTDNNGNFRLKVSGIKNNDTLLISSVGYETLRVPLSKAAKKDKYILKAYSQKMEAVVVRSFSNEDVAGAKSDKVGYFRAWNTDNRGGEIGRSLHVPHKEYQVSKVRFKIYTSCDTCIIRLHIRKLSDGVPGDDLLDSSFVQTFYNASVADKTYDFDILDRNIILTEKNIFVGFEVLKGSSQNTYCSLAFAGSELGRYFYKSDKNDFWNMTDDYTIHLKVFFRYD